jgi:hypothetical protein
MFWTIFYGIGTLWLLAGNSLVPNNFLTAMWWAVGICGLIPYLFLIESKETHKKRNCEEAEWYILNYQRIWCAPNPWNALSSFDTDTAIYYKPDDYRARKRRELYWDIRENLDNRLYGRPLVDTYSKSCGWMSINCVGSELYEPKYKGVVNDIEKLKAWKPSMEIDMG